LDLTALRQLKVTKTILIWQRCYLIGNSRSKKLPQFDKTLAGLSYLFYVNHRRHKPARALIKTADIFHAFKWQANRRRVIKIVNSASFKFCFSPGENQFA